MARFPHQHVVVCPSKFLNCFLFFCVSQFAARLEVAECYLTWPTNAEVCYLTWPTKAEIRSVWRVDSECDLAGAPALRVAVRAGVDLGPLVLQMVFQVQAPTKRPVALCAKDIPTIQHCRRNAKAGDSFAQYP